MAEKNELMTIKAFASASGRSQQAIYKQIGTRLSAYLHEVEGQKYIERRALFEVFGIGEEVEQCETNLFNRKKTESSDSVVALLERTVAMLEEQLKAKDQQIADLTSANKELAQSINADRKNELAGTIREMLPDGEASEASGEVVEIVQDEESVELTPEHSEPQSDLREAVRGLSFGQKVRLLFGKSRD